MDTPIREFQRDYRGRSLLHFIATWEWTSVLRRYIECKRPIIDVRDRLRRTPLHYASIYGNTGVVDVLLGKGAVVDRRDGIGCTALHYAIQQGHLQIAHMLLLNGASLLNPDGFRRTCLNISIASGEPSIIDYMLNQRGLDAMAQDMWGKSALHKAAGSNGELVTCLLPYCEDVNQKDA